MFKEDIKRSIGTVLKESGHKAVPIARHCVYYIKRYSEKLAFYVRCIDSRSHERGITVEMFFAPIQIPDDRLLSSEVGIHIHIITIYENVSDEIMIAAGKKVVAIEDSIGNVSDVIVEEIEIPYFPEGINDVYNQDLLIYYTINEDIDIKEKFTTLKREACKAIKKRKSNQIFYMCSELIDSLPENYFSIKGIDLEINDIKNILSEHVRAHSMLDA